MAMSTGTGMHQIILIVCSWFMSSHKTLCTVQVICANSTICCTTAISGTLESCLAAPYNLVCSSQFFLTQVQIFWMVSFSTQFFNSVASKCRHVSCLSQKSITLIQIVEEQKQFPVMPWRSYIFCIYTSRTLLIHHSQSSKLLYI